MKVNLGKSNLIALVFVCLSTTVVASKPTNHDIWSNLLANHVTEDGKVNYKGFITDKAKLNEYLNLLANSTPEESWGKDNIMVFWINAYNAFTIKLIVDNYPLKSIMDLKFEDKSAWDYTFIKINNQDMTLNYIEHEILRKNYKDPRIHFAVNCASYSCPRLLNKAFASDNLNEQLDKMTKEFVNNNLHNKLSGNKS